MIEELKIIWPVSGTVQSFRNVRPNQFLKITEGENEFELMNIKAFEVKKEEKPAMHHNH